MSNHTKAPWLFDGKVVYALNEKWVNIFSAFVQDGKTGEDELKANARRIVACVNACEGISTETLEQGSTLAKITKSASDELAAARNMQGNIEDRIARLAQQRDELLAAIKSFGHKVGCRKNAFGDTCTCGVDSVIAKVKGGALNTDTGIQTEPLLMPICFNVDRSELERKLGQETMKSIDDCNAITRELYNEEIRQHYKLAKQNVRLFNDLRYTCENPTFGGTYTREVDDVIASVKGGTA